MGISPHVLMGGRPGGLPNILRIDGLFPIIEQYLATNPAPLTGTHLDMAPKELATVPP